MRHGDEWAGVGEEQFRDVIKSSDSVMTTGPVIAHTCRGFFDSNHNLNHKSYSKPAP
jgi:hypothetical protein